MIVFEAIAVCVGLLLILSHLIERIPAQRGVLLGVAAGLGFGISDVAIKALSGTSVGRSACSAPGAWSSSRRRSSRSTPPPAASRSATAWR